MSAADLMRTPTDFVVLAGQRSPGIAYVEGAELSRRLHERRAFGVSGATVIDQGAELAHFTVRLYLTTEDELDAWDTWKALLVRPAQRSTQGQDIEHPILADLGISAVLLEGRSQLSQDEVGGWTVTIKFCEFRRPVPALSAPDSASAAPQDIYEQQIAIAADETNRLFQQLTDPQTQAGAP